MASGEWSKYKHLGGQMAAWRRKGQTKISKTCWVYSPEGQRFVEPELCWLELGTFNTHFL